jgi:predicted nucleic acid-binding OB-fold protein
VSKSGTLKTLKIFSKNKFYDRKILPKVAIFCRTANAFAPTEVVQFMFDEFKKHGILLLFVIPKWPFIPKSEQDSIFQEAVSLLDGKATPIYGRASKGYKAYECEPKKSYIIPVNSKEDTILGMTVKVSNINTLRKILVTKLDKESQGKLVQLYKDNLGFWNKLGYGAIEILDDLGLNTAEVILTEEERKIYEKVKDGDERIKNIKLIFKIVDKILRGNQ